MTYYYSCTCELPVEYIGVTPSVEESPSGVSPKGDVSLGSGRLAEADPEMSGKVGVRKMKCRSQKQKADPEKTRKMTEAEVKVRKMTEAERMARLEEIVFENGDAVGLRRVDMARELGVSLTQVKLDLQKLEARGKIRFDGPGSHSGHWHIVSDPESVVDVEVWLGVRSAVLTPRDVCALTPREYQDRKREIIRKEGVRAERVQEVKEYARRTADYVMDRVVNLYSPEWKTHF